MALPSQYYYACFPLQEYFVDKDTGFPLAAGYVEFYSDPNFTVPKNVFQQNQAPGPTYTYVSLGHVLTLSSVGTFQDNSGIDIIPYLYPFTGTPPANPNTAPTGTIEPYFIRVYSSGGILQFTREGWPPQLQSQSALVDTFESSQNAITNSQFSTVSFVSDTLNQVSYTYAPTGTYSFDVAPGWQIVTTGNGSVTVKQLAIATNPVPGTPFAYALEITTDANITDCKLVQKIINTPRLYQDLFVSACLTAASNTDAVTIDMIYAPSNGVTPTTIMSQQTIGGGLYKQLIGLTSALFPVQITEADNFAPPAYVDIQITIPVARTITITAVQMVTVANADSYVPYAAQSVPQQTNTEFWQYKDKLADKPIPSYTIGWDFGMNPFQAQGTAGFTYNPSAGKSVYVADQTILFQNTVNSVTVSRVNNEYMQLGMINNTTSTAIVQYLGAAEAVELLKGRMCVRLKADVSSGSLKGQVNLYYTNAALPTMDGASATGGDSLVISVDGTTAEPTVGSGAPYGTWTKVNRSNLNAAKFVLTNSMTDYGFTGWDATGQPNINTATGFAIVVSFADYSPGNNIGIDYCTLQKGDIPTPPPAMSAGETLTALQYYYEKSYNNSVIPGANNSAGVVACYSTSAASGGSTYIYPSTFSLGFKTTKRADAIVRFYTPSGTIDAIGASINLGGVPQAFAPNSFSTNDWTYISSQNSIIATPAANSNCSIANTNLNTSAAVIFQYTADARLGIV